MAENIPLVARIMVEHGGGGPPTGPGVEAATAIGDDDTSDQKETSTNIKKIALSMAKNTKGVLGNLGKTLGISVGISSILKQSQVFTGYIGTIFQLMGALVDVILAPFLPIVIPAIKLLASFIPITRDLMADLVKNLTTGFLWLKGAFKTFSSKYLSWLPSLPKNTGLWFKKALVMVVLGSFFIKLFGLQKFVLSTTMSMARLQLRLLQVIAVNTARGSSSVIGISKGFRKTGGAMIKGAFRRLGILVVISMAMAALYTLVSRFFRFSKDNSDKSSASFGPTRLERQQTDAGTNKPVLDKIAEGTQTVRVGIGVAAATKKYLGTRISSVADWIKNIGREQGKDAKGRFTKNTTLWERIGKKLGLVGKGAEEVVDNKSSSLFGRITKSLGGIRGVAKVAVLSTRFLPIIGSITELVYGGIKTFQSFRDHGMAAGFARAGVTTAATLGTLVDPSGVTSALLSLAAHESLNQLENRGHLGNTTIPTVVENKIHINIIPGDLDNPLNMNTVDDKANTKFTITETANRVYNR